MRDLPAAANRADDYGRPKPDWTYPTRRQRAVMKKAAKRLRKRAARLQKRSKASA